MRFCLVLALVLAVAFAIRYFLGDRQSVKQIEIRDPQQNADMISWGAKQRDKTTRTK